MLKLYTKGDCPQCVQMKITLALNNIKYETQDIFKNQEVLSFLRDNGHRSMPQAFIDGKHLGGVVEITKYLKTL